MTTRYETTCRICRQPFVADAFVPILNGGADPRLASFGNQLFQHMVQRHASELGAFLIVTCFNLTDPVLIGIFEPLRWAVQQNTRRANVTDEQLQNRINKLADDINDPQVIHEPPLILVMLRDLRDYLTEQGAYAPKPVEAPSMIVS